MDNLIGKRLDGRYLIESVIGVGGMANVYKGQDVKTGTTVAVKVLKEEFLDNEELVRRFKNESKAISILDHPNIVKVYDVSVTDRLQYIVMEYIDGITLKEYLKQRGGPLTWKEVVYFATQVLSALSHAHSKGIVHRDVKPQNIMLLADGSIKMMDFGIARFSRAQNQTVSDKAIGSVHYISPEQAKGDHTDARTDIYSVGVMLYEMLSGRLPFDGNGAVSIAIKQISDKPTPLAEVAPNVPEGLRQITERAMEKDPKDRYQSAQEMLAAIDEFKKNPSIRFEYEYLTQDSPNKTINKVVNNSKMSSSSNIRTGSAKRSNGSAPKPGNSKIKKKKKSGRFSVLPVFAGMAVAFAIGAFVLVYLIFANSANPLFSSREDVTLINFVNMTQQEFLNSEYNSKLHPIWVSEYNNKYDEGVIFQQNPQPGRTVKEGQRVTLKVSMGTQWVSVPETQSMTKADAVQSIKDAGLVPVTKSVADDSVAAGTVIRTEPAAGESVAGGATVKVYVSRAKVDT
ncbi:MAG: Stk1 family PASTA domain-containing Ser/Thr kinase, partial [Gemmiger sp.]